MILFPLLLLAPTFDPDPAHWQATAVPPKTERSNRRVWEYAAGYSKYEWRVLLRKNLVRAELGGDRPLPPPADAPFLPKGYGTTYHRVGDGWLVGANHGEWGGSLSWISPDGKRRRKVSDDQIVAFFTLPDGLYAVQGLAHLGMSSGSVIRIDRPRSGAPWTARKVTDLPDAPFSVAVRRDGTALLTLLKGVATFGSDHRVRPLLPEAPLRGLYPNSSVLSNDESRLYIGMRAYVGELDLRTKGLRLLVPSTAFINHLSKDQEQRIRTQPAASAQFAFRASA